VVSTQVSTLAALVASAAAPIFENGRAAAQAVRDCKSDFLLLAYRGGIDLAASLTRARCCDAASRTPAKCFLDPARVARCAESGTQCTAPRSNFVMSRHFATLGVVTLRPCPAASIQRRRVDETGAAFRHADTFAWLHNRTRGDVAVRAAPRMTDPVLGFRDLPAAERRRVVAAAVAAAAA